MKVTQLMCQKIKHVIRYEIRNDLFKELFFLRAWTTKRSPEGKLVLVSVHSDLIIAHDDS